MVREEGFDGGPYLTPSRPARLRARVRACGSGSEGEGREVRGAGRRFAGVFGERLRAQAKPRPSPKRRQAFHFSRNTGLLFDLYVQRHGRATMQRRGLGR